MNSKPNREKTITNGYLTTPKVHPVYNDQQCFAFDVLRFEPHIKYRIFIKMIECKYNDGVFFPFLGIVGGCGELECSQRDNSWKYSPLYSAVVLTKNEPSATLLFSAEDGLLQVDYICRYSPIYSPRLKLWDFSSNGIHCAMKKEILTDNSVLYVCRHVNDESSVINAFSFEIQWEKVIGS